MASAQIKPLNALIAVLTFAAAGCTPPLDGPVVEDNPHSTISCVVRWTTDDPGTTRVEFGEDGLAYYVEDTELVIDHEIAVIGMRSSSTYRWEAVSVLEDGTELRSEAGSYTTGALPFDDLVLELTTFDDARKEPGWTLTNVAIADVFSPVRVMMLDDQGQVVWYHELEGEEGRADIEVTLVDGERVLIGGGIGSYQRATEVSLAGEVVWEGPEQVDITEFLTPGEMHHQFHRRANGNYMVLSYELVDNEGFDIIEEITPELETVWRWRAAEHLAGAHPIYAWGNAALLDADPDAVFYNTRNISTLYRIDRASGELEWSFGEDGDFAMLTEHDWPWPSHAHAPEFLADGHLLLYDNGDMGRDFSRVIEYVLDQDAKTAEIVWEYPGALANDVWFNFAMGDADRLPGGNTLVTVGTLVEGDSQSRLFEVTPGGEIVWEVTFAGASGAPAGGFMAERIQALVGSL